MATYLSAIRTHIEAPAPRLVDLDADSLRAARQARYGVYVQAHGTRGGRAANGHDRFGRLGKFAQFAQCDTDILDAEFIAFHRGLREHMLDNHGVLADSEAFDLHEAVAPCVRVQDASELSGV